MGAWTSSCGCIYGPLSEMREEIARLSLCEKHEDDLRNEWGPKMAIPKKLKQVKKR